MKASPLKLYRGKDIHFTGDTSQCKEASNKNKGVNIENQEVKLSLVTNDVIVSVTASKNAAKCLLE